MGSNNYGICHNHLIGNSVHVCRHTYCTNKAKSGMNPKTLQYLMGHSEISVTMDTYTHLGLQDAWEELQRLQLEFSKKEMGLRVVKTA